MTRGPNITPEQEEKLFVQMRRHDEQHAFMIKSWSGSDQAESELPRMQRLFYVAVWSGVDIEDALREGDRTWRAYAAMNNARVEAAPKTRHGLYQGQSCIHYRWVSPEHWVSSEPHLRTMLKIILGES